SARPLRHEGDRLSPLPARARAEAAGRPPSGRPASPRSRRALRSGLAAARRRPWTGRGRPTLRARPGRDHHAWAHHRGRPPRDGPRDGHTARPRARTTDLAPTDARARGIAPELAGHHGPGRPRCRLRHPARRAAMSRAAVAAELVRTHARTLKMPALARRFVALARHARGGRCTVARYLNGMPAAG